MKYLFILVPFSPAVNAWQIWAGKESGEEPVQLSPAEALSAVGVSPEAAGEINVSKMDLFNGEVVSFKGGALLLREVLRRTLDAELTPFANGGFMVKVSVSDDEKPNVEVD